MRNFKLHSLLRNTSDALTEPLELDSSDLALATSPNFYAIAFAGNTRTPTGQADYHSEAPNLKELGYKHMRMKDRPSLRRNREGREPYPGLTLSRGSFKKGFAIGQLLSLSLYEQEPPLARWQKGTNFDMLQTLRLGNTDAGVLEWAADHVKLPSLSTLELHTGPGETGSSSATLLRSLPLLTDLTVLSHVNNETLDTISNHHGTTLQRLSMPDFLCSIDDIRSLRQGCQQLDHLSIMIARTEGDQYECEHYRELGRLAKIQSLHLGLDCSVNVGTESVCDEPSYNPVLRDTNYKKDFVRRTLVNCAVDGTLAAAIFRRISAATERPHRPLQSLELGTTELAFSFHASRTVTVIRGPMFISTSHDDGYAVSTREMIGDMN